MEVLIGIGVVVVIALIVEYRVRKPDEVILVETRTGMRTRTGRFYPRHFSFPVARTTHAFQSTVDATAKGNLDIRVKLAVTVAAAMDHLPVLMRVGGWHADAVARAAKELEVLLHGYVKEFTEQVSIEQLSSEKIHAWLEQKTAGVKPTLGLDLVTLAIQSFETADPQIAEALRQQEHARIMEQTESLSQKARIAAARARLQADEEIARLQHAVDLRALDLRAEHAAKESSLADQQVNDELKRSRKRLEFERDELELLKNNPELLMLTPQAARLAEASQGLKNARTVVSLSPQDLAQGSELLGLFQRLLHGALNGGKEKKSAAKEK